MQIQIFLTMHTLYAQLTQHFEFFFGNKFVHKMATLVKAIFSQSKKKRKRPNNIELLEIQQK